MFKRATTKLDTVSVTGLPVQHIHTGSGVALAVHVHGTLSDSTIPVVCLPGYVRNMADFSALVPAINRHPGTDLCFVLIDLAGRGASGRLKGKMAYSSLADAHSVLDVLTALDISKAVLMGEGHGGQVAMLMAQQRPGLVAGTVLIDAGPVIDPRGLVRTRNNHRHLERLRGEAALRAALRKILATNYPGEIPAHLDALAERAYGTDARGRLKPLFDPRLIAQLDQFDFDDVLEPQWRLFDCLGHAPLMIVHTQLSDQVRRATYMEMARKRPDAATLAIAGQGSPALLDGSEEHTALVEFLRPVCRPAAESFVDD